jgi:hypothetical protein
MKQITVMIPRSTWYSYLAVVDDDLVERLDYVDEEELYKLLEPHIDWESRVEEDYWDRPNIQILHIKQVETQ